MSNDRRYGTSEWKQLRRAVLERDRYVCHLRLPGCTHTATEADHLTPPSQGGDFYDPTNVRAACKKCNIAKRNYPYTPGPSRQW